MMLAWLLSGGDVSVFEVDSRVVVTHWAEYLEFVGLSCETLKEFRWDVNELMPSSLAGGLFTKEIK